MQRGGVVDDSVMGSRLSETFDCLLAIMIDCEKPV